MKKGRTFFLQAFASIDDRQERKKNPGKGGMDQKKNKKSLALPREGSYKRVSGKKKQRQSREKGKSEALPKAGRKGGMKGPYTGRAAF